MMRTPISVGLAAVITGILTLNCDRPEKPYGDPLAGYNPAPGNWVPPVTEEKAETQERETKVELRTAKGANIDVEVTLTETDDGVRMLAIVENAPPGRHSFRLVEQGGCRLEGESDGDSPPERQQELGDIDVGADGAGRLRVAIPGKNLDRDDRMSLAGQAIVLDSVGRAAAGVPIACGIIERE